MRAPSSSSPIASCSPTTALLLLALLTVIHILPASASTTVLSCSPTGAIDTNSTYGANVAQVLSSLITATPPTGFSNLTAGDAPDDRVYGLALCRGDLNSTVCRACLRTAAADAAIQCPGSAAAALYYDGCRIRYSPEPFFSTLVPDPVDPYFFSLRWLPDDGAFRDKFGRLMGGLLERAAFGNGSGLFASGWAEYGLGGADRLYGLVQCTRDLSGDQCARCLDAAIWMILDSRPREEVTFQGGSCYLRQAFWPFFNASVVAPPLGAPPGGVAGNTSVDQSPDGSAPPVFSVGGGGASGSGAGKKHVFMAVGVVAVGVTLLAFLILVAVKATRKKKPRPIILGTRNLELHEEQGLKFHRLASRKKNFSRAPDAGPMDAQKLDVPALRMATDKFSQSRLLGRGEYGLVYKGELSGREFAVKRITAQARMGVDHVRKELKSFAKLQHPNIAKVMACHIEEDEKVLVYEYYHNTSLDQILFDNKKRVLLDWGRRFKIIEGIGQGLLHLHGDSGVNIIHQNLKASNVLLDRQMAPKLSDMCLPAYFLGTQTSPGGHAKRSSAATAYMAPEYLATGISSAKTDVYSYGVLLLEIITGQRNREFLGPDNGTNLLTYVWQYWKDEKALQVLDWSLGELYKAHEVLRCIHVGLLCVQEDADKRPGISTVVNMLNSFSFTLPSPSAPPVTRGGSTRRNGNSGLPPHPSNGNRYLDRNITQLSPRSASSWADIKLDSR